MCVNETFAQLWPQCEHYGWLVKEWRHLQLQAIFQVKLVGRSCYFNCGEETALNFLQTFNGATEHEIVANMCSAELVDTRYEL